jgi:hypothetical protein
MTKDPSSISIDHTFEVQVEVIKSRVTLLTVRASSEEEAKTMAASILRKKTEECQQLLKGAPIRTQGVDASRILR